MLQIFDKTIAAPNILINLAKETKTALKHALVCPCFFRQACRWPLVSYVCSAAPAPIPIVMAPLFPANTHYFNLESQRCHFLSPLWELLLVQISWSNSTSSWHKHHKCPGSGQRLAIRGANYLCPEYGFGLAPALTCQPQTERPRWTKTQLGILRRIFRGQLECICKGDRINENRFFCPTCCWPTEYQICSAPMLWSLKSLSCQPFWNTMRCLNEPLVAQTNNYNDKLEVGGLCLFDLCVCVEQKMPL